MPIDETTGFGLWVFDRGFDARGYIEPFCDDCRHFVIRQCGNRTVILPGGVHVRLDHLVDKRFAQRRTTVVHQQVFLPHRPTPLYVVAYRTVGHDTPVILLTDRCPATDERAVQFRNVYVHRWECETAVQCLKDRLGLEQFAVRRYRSIQRIGVLAGLAMAFLTFVQSRCRSVYEHLRDPLRYARDPKSLWTFRLIDRLREALKRRAHRTLAPWCASP